MNSFSTTTHLSKKEYIGFVYRELYRKPQFILTTLIGLYLLGTVILDYLGAISFYTTPPYVELIGGILILGVPNLALFFAAKGFYANPSLQHGIEYTFSEEGVAAKGLTFEGSFKWSHIIKVRETKKFLLLYNSKKLANFIDKTKLTREQIEFIKSKVAK